jgi:TolA-binding protein
MMFLAGWGSIPVLVMLWAMLFGSETLAAGGRASESQMLAAAAGAYEDKLYPLAESQTLEFLERFPQSHHKCDMTYLLGRIYFVQGKFRKARETFLALINISDVDLVDQTNGLFWLAESCAQLDRWEEAKAYYLEFLGKTSESPFLEKSLFALGLIFLREKNLVEAETYFSRGVVKYLNGPYVSQAQYYRGLIYSQWKNYHRAVQLLRQAIFAPSRLPDSLRHNALFQLAENRVKLGQFQLALPYYTDFYKTYPQDSRSPFALYGAAWCQLKTGQKRAALESFQNLVKQFPKSDPYPHALYRIGEIHLGEKDYEKARGSFMQLIKEYPDSDLTIPTLVDLGWCHLNLGDLDAMTRVAHRLLKISSNPMEKTLPQLLLGEAHFQRGQYKDALPYFFNLLNTPSQRKNALYRISRCYFYEGEYKDAITNVEILELEYPDTELLEECLYLKGQAAYHLGDIEKAIASFLEVLGKKRENSWRLAALYDLGKIYYERKDLKKAIDFFSAIVRTAPEVPTAILASYYLGIIHDKENRSSDALRYLNHALGSTNRAIRAESHYRMGCIYLERNDHIAALHHFQTIIDTLADQRGWVELALFQTGNVRLARGESTEARKAFQKVLEVSKDSDLRNASETMLASPEALKPEP